MAVKVDTQKEIIFGSSDPNVSRVLSKKIGVAYAINKGTTPTERHL